jgi:hypothetical protein
MQTIDLRQAIGDIVTHLDNRPRCECMEYRVINCAGAEVAFAGLGDGPYVPGFAPLGKTVSCIRIDGHDAIVRLRMLQQELRPAVESADNDDSVRFIADELAYRIPFLPVGRDETVNQGLRVRGFEYVRTDYLEALKGALSRLPVTDSAGAEQGGKNGGSMSQRIEVKDSPGTTVNQIIGSSNRASQNQAKEGFLQQIGRQLLRWLSGLSSRPHKPKGS